MKNISEILKNHKDSNSVFVFPSEAAAVSRRKEFLSLTNTRAVRNDRFMSWDSFKEKITLHDFDDKPVNSVHRKLFTSDLLHKNSEESPLFSIIVPSGYSKNSHAFIDFICRLLPELKGLIDILNAAPSDSLKADYQILYTHYCRFLSENGLFEPSWVQPDFAKLNKKIYIIYPELIEDFDEYEVELKKLGCDVINLSSEYLFSDASAPPELRVFENTAIESDVILDEISDLLKAGVEAYDIVVTAADQSIAENLCFKAQLRGIPLNTRSGKPLAEYPAGRLPEFIRSCSSSGYNIESMKNLLLYRAFRWRDTKNASDLIRFGITNRCLKNTSASKEGDVWADRLKAAKNLKLGNFYRGLKYQIEAIVRASSFEDLSKQFQIFVSNFLETDAGLWDPECEKVFQRSREVLASLKETAGELKNISIKDPLSLWIDSLKDKIYVQQQPGPGIDVYPYRVSALINPRVHFIAGLSNDSSSVVSPMFGFLPEQQRNYLGASDKNMTDHFIAAYSESGSDVRFSCSAETPSGAALPPGCFIKGRKIKYVNYSAEGSCGAEFKDPFLAESLWWKDACRGTFRPLPELCGTQIDGFNYASATFMQPGGLNAADCPLPEGELRELIMKGFKEGDEQTGRIRVSASTLDSWSSCPFKSMLFSSLKIYEDEYILKPEDPFTIGNVMHEVLYELFKRLKKDKKPFRASDIDKYKSIIKDSAACVFRRWEDEENYFYGPAWGAMKRRVLSLLDNFPEAELEQYEGYYPYSMEQRFEYELEDLKIDLVGRIDRISSDSLKPADIDDPPGVVIVDYKKSWKGKNGNKKFIKYDSNNRLLVPERGFQLPFYILLAESAGLDVVGTSYYGITEGRHFPVTGKGGVLNEEEIEALLSLTVEYITKMAAAIRDGDFMAVKRCEGCGYRAVCRKRFNVKWSGK